MVLTRTSVYSRTLSHIHVPFVEVFKPSMNPDYSRVTINGYQIISRLAIGGMAEVFLAKQHAAGGMSRTIVIKRILPHLADDQNFVDMFLREGRIIAQINHPNVVNILELGLDNGQYFMALEYIHGVTLRELQVLAHKQSVPLEAPLALSIIVQVARGLHAVHETKDEAGNLLGIVHRDITPHNLMCTLTGNIKLLDFGIAKSTSHLDEATYSGDLKGKFSYMSPEQALQKGLDRRSDIFALGVVLWELFTGRRLFKRDSQLDMLKAVTNEDTPAPSTYVPHLPPRLDVITLKALARDPEQRYQSVQDLQSDLSACARDLGWDVSQEALHAYMNQVAAQALEHKEQDESDLSDVITLSRQHSITYSQTNSTSTEDPTVVQNTATGQHPLQEISLPEVPQQKPTSKRGLRLSVLAGFLMVIGVGVLGLTYAFNSPPTYDGPPVVITLAPTLEPEILIKEMNPLAVYLSKKLQRSVSFEVSKDYQDAADQLSQGRVSFAVLPPAIYLLSKDKDPELTPLVLKEFDGSVSSDALLIASMRTSYTSVDGLKDARFCFTDLNSTTGFILPQAFLREKGYAPATLSTHMSGDHLQLIRDILDGTCDVGGTYNGAILAADRMNLPVSNLRTIAITGHTPQDTLTSRTSVDGALREQVKRALLEFEPQRDIGETSLGVTQRITGFQEIKDRSSFQRLRKAMGLPERQD